MRTNEHLANIASSARLGDLPEIPNWNFLTNFVHSKLPAGSDLFSIPPITEDSVFSSLSRLPRARLLALMGSVGFFLKIAASAISSSLNSIFSRLSLSCRLATSRPHENPRRKCLRANRDISYAKWISTPYACYMRRRTFRKSILPVVFFQTSLLDRSNFRAISVS